MNGPRSRRPYRSHGGAGLFVVAAVCLIAGVIVVAAGPVLAGLAVIGLAVALAVAGVAVDYQAEQEAARRRYRASACRPDRFRRNSRITQEIERRGAR